MFKRGEIAAEKIRNIMLTAFILKHKNLFCWPKIVRNLSSILFVFLLVGFSNCSKVTDPPGHNYTYNPIPYGIEFSSQFPILEIPENNPTTIAGVELGRRLYYDPILHPDGNHSCASCHVQKKFIHFGW